MLDFVAAFPSVDAPFVEVAGDLPHLCDWGIAVRVLYLPDLAGHLAQCLVPDLVLDLLAFGSVPIRSCLGELVGLHVIAQL